MKTLMVKTWKQVRSRVMGVNEFVASEIDKIPGVENFKVISVRYPFGAKVIDRGEFHLCIDGKDVPFNSDRVPFEIREILNYKWEGMPFGIVMHNSTESFIDHTDQIVPFRLKVPGNTFALLSIFENPHFIPSLRSEVAGCRSLLALPKLSEKRGLDALRQHLDVDFNDPKEYSDHWQLFKAVENAPTSEEHWYAELFYFSHEFMQNLGTENTFREKLISFAWKFNSFSVNLKTYEFLWSVVVNKLRNENVMAKGVLQDPFIIQTAKHIIKIACGEGPGYIPATTNLSGPIENLTRELIDTYKIRNKMPVFMRLADLYDGQSSVYYTLSNHTFLHDMPLLSYKRQTVVDMTRIYKVVEAFRNFILNNEGEHALESTLLYKTLASTEITFFHPKGEAPLNNKVEALVREDARFDYHPFYVDKKYEFPASSIFFHGCIRVRPKRR
jgi:hypothetical protein